MVLYDIGSVKLLIISAITSTDIFALFHQCINKTCLILLSLFFTLQPQHPSPYTLSNPDIIFR